LRRKIEATIGLNLGNAPVGSARISRLVAVERRRYLEAMQYEPDYLIWSEQQAALLRRLAAGERVNDSIDWPNVLEEVADVGLSGLRAVKSLLRQAMLHMLKAQAWPLSRDAPTWRADAAEFRAQAEDAFAPSMRERIDLDSIYRKALKTMPETVDGVSPGPVPETCQWTLDEMLGYW
jgi:hypothetical protein